MFNQNSALDSTVKSLIMKKSIFIIFMVLGLPGMCLAQSKTKIPATTVRKAAEVAKIDSLLQECRELRKDISFYSSTKNRYKLYPTENIYTFLKLNTETGQIWHVQWGWNIEDRFIRQIF